MRLGHLLSVVVLFAAAPALAEEPQPLGPAELDALRGGIATPFGDIGFAASVRTFVDGALALETRMVWTDQGPRTERVFDAGARGVVIGSGLGAAFSTPEGGATIVHDLAANRIASVLVNRGSDRSFRQETDITLYLPQLPDLQQQIAAARLAASFQDAAPVR